MDLLAAWLLFPLALGALALGGGLLVERLSGVRLPGALLLPAGFAAILALSRLLAESTPTAKVALPVLILVAAAGAVVGWARLRGLRPERFAAAAALGVFLVLGAPVILSGEPSFAGSLVLADTGHQLSLAALLGEHGPEWATLPNSSFRLGVRKYMVTAYPLAPQAALGALAPLGALDMAWLYQPFLSFSAAMAALALYVLAGRWIPTPAGRGLVAFLAAQPALVAAFALQGSIKELTGLATVLLAVAAVALALEERWPARAFLPAALGLVAGLGSLGLPAAVYLGPPLAVLAAAWLRRLRRAPKRAELLGAIAVAAAAVLLALPVLSGASRAYTVAGNVLSKPEDLGNLARPLSAFQASGIWLTGDYRFPARMEPLNAALIAVTLAGAALGLGWSVRRRATGPLLLTVTLAIASAYLLVRGNSYADAKVLVLLSPLPVLLALVGALALLASRRLRIVGAALAFAVAGGVLASNALLYRETQLAPYERYRELSQIDDRLAGQGPVLFTEYDEYAKFFLRDSRPLSQPEYPYEYPPGRLNHPSWRVAVTDNPQHPSIKTPLDLDALAPSTVQAMPAIVMRRSPTASRPPANFRRTYVGRYYEVWRRQAGTVARHLPLGRDVFNAGAAPRCSRVRALARQARRTGARLAYVERPPLPLFDLLRLSDQNRLGFSIRDRYAAYPKSIVVAGPGTAAAELYVPRAGRYRLWLEGSFGRRVTVRVDGREVGTVAYEPGNAGQYLPLGTVDLGAGSHGVEIERGGGDLRPGNGGGYISNVLHIGPLVFSPPENEDRRVRWAEPREAETLCGRRVDWIELVRPA